MTLPELRRCLAGHYYVAMRIEDICPTCIEVDGLREEVQRLRAEKHSGSWRVGGKVPLNVYENDVPMFQCHTPEQAARIVELLNRAEYPFGSVTRG